MKLQIEAPAKINRELRVGALRPDGFHEMRSRMISIDLADRLTAEPADRLVFTCDDPAVPAGAANLVVRAAERLAEAGGVAARAHVHLSKRVPMGGGLGGGSADAAATLLLLSRFWGLDLPARESEALAAGLGSDVPFFLDGGQADVAGRGERVTAVPDGPPVDLLLLVPPFSISTADVYRLFGGRGALPDELEVAEASRTRFLGPNDLAPAVVKIEPRMVAYLESAARMTDDWVISGSGATVVLHGAAQDAKAWLAHRHPEARLFHCRTLSRPEYEARLRPVTVGP